MLLRNHHHEWGKRGSGCRAPQVPMRPRLNGSTHPDERRKSVARWPRRGLVTVAGGLLQGILGALDRAVNAILGTVHYVAAHLLTCTHHAIAGSRTRRHQIIATKIRREAGRATVRRGRVVGLGRQCHRQRATTTGEVDVRRDGGTARQLLDMCGRPSRIQSRLCYPLAILEL